MTDILERARQKVLEDGTPLNKDELLEVLELPDDRIDELLQLAHEVRLKWCGEEIEVEGIVSLKTGGCPEDCRFCSQSALYESPVKAVRLDIDSTGLLVLTQDGRIAKQLIGQDTAIEKEYLVRVQYTKPGRLPDEDLRKLNHGLWMDGKPLLPAKVRWQNDDQLSFTLKEGKKRQIRRMCDMVGLKVVGLKRVRIGRVKLGDLPVGQWRYLGADESF